MSLPLSNAPSSMGRQRRQSPRMLPAARGRVTSLLGGPRLIGRPRPVEPDAGQVSEQGVKPLDDRRRQGGTEDRVDVVLHVSLVAGPEENDIDTLFMARVAIRGVRDAFR